MMLHSKTFKSIMVGVIYFMVNAGQADNNHWQHSYGLSPDNDMDQRCEKPVANSGDNQTVSINELVALDGSGSKGTELTYAWNMISKPEESEAALKYATFPSPIFLPDKIGEYVIELVVCNKEQNKDADTVVVTAIDKKKFKGIVLLNLAIDDEPCVEYKVYLCDSFNKKRIVTTDADGSVKFKNVPNGRFDLSIKENLSPEMSVLAGKLMINGMPAGNSRVKFTLYDGNSLITQTDETGCFQISIQHGGGEYTLEVRGYIPESLRR
ncbi:MAG: hypothetical protein JW795_22220 [Chitinivibrionales bacterium]|nr:hypothetical protein [Chitinivibrionales bacterium]